MHSSELDRDTLGDMGASAGRRRNSRMVGSRGLFSRLGIQRQSAATRNNVQTGRPRAPARRTTMGVNGHDQVQMGHDSDSFKNIAAGVQPSLAANVPAADPRSQP